MQPIPESRWKIKELDDGKNIEDALAYITLVVDVFKFLAETEIQGQLRDAHNKITVEFSVFMDAVVAARAERGEPRPDYDVTVLYKFYMMYVHFSIASHGIH